MAKRYSIGELAREADVPTSTVRYYERRGLLRAAERSDGNYRLYDDAGLDRLRFIRSAQHAGFTLKDIESLLGLRDGDIAPCCEVQDLISARLERVRDEIDHLTGVDTMLRSWLRACRSAGRRGRCPVLEGLAAGEEKKSLKKTRESS